MLIDNAKSVRISNNSRSRQKKTVLRKKFYSQDKALKSIEMSTSNYFYILVFYVNIYVSKVIVTQGNLHKKMILKCI